MDRFRTRAKRLRSLQTSAEARLWRALRSRQLEQWKFRRQHPIGVYTVDFACLQNKIVIEVDGATHSSAKELARDKARTSFIEAQGFLVLRVTNQDVYENLEGVMEMIFRTLRP